jgi:hypothetical protein
VDRLQAAFDIFDAANPRFWILFESFTQAVIDRGFTKFSVANIYERVRWEVQIATDSDDGFKLNNNHRAYYARKWLKLHPEYPKFFEIRITRQERKAQWPLPKKPRDDEDNGQGEVF